MKITIAIIIASLIAISIAKGQTFEEITACAGDAFHFCKREAKSLDMAGIKRCLVSHRKKISYRCRDTLEKHGA